MTQHGIDFLKFMFKDNETICVSHNKYGYHSLPLSEVIEKSEITLVPTEDSCTKRGLVWGPEVFEKVSTDRLVLVALNPIKGFRVDESCTAFRNFLVEIDTGDLKSQLDYIDNMGLPYSGVVFSGSKSLHFLISLDSDLPNEKVWRTLNEWILNSLPMADQQTKNPTRSIRIPGAVREGKGLQRLVKMVGKVSLDDLKKYLSRFPDAKPKQYEKRKISDKLDISKITVPWVRKALLYGLDSNKSRNQQWFSISCEFTLAGYELSDIIEVLSHFFTPQRDFSKREWIGAVKSGYKHIKNKAGK
jgi:hypothetical protein